MVKQRIIIEKECSGLALYGHTILGNCRLDADKVHLLGISLEVVDGSHYRESPMTMHRSLYSSLVVLRGEILLFYLLSIKLIHPFDVLPYGL